MMSNSETLNKLNRDMKKIKNAEERIMEQEKYLKKLCEIIRMEEVKEILLKEGNVDEEKYLEALDEVDQIVVELKEWEIDAPLIIQIR